MVEARILQCVGDRWVWDDAHTLITEKWKYTVRSDADKGQLFDRLNDLSELDNLWCKPSHREVRAALAERTVACISQAKEHAWRQEVLW
jgi:hypothetical protein